MTSEKNDKLLLRSAQILWYKSLLILAVLTAFDQLTKILAVLGLKQRPPFAIIPNVFVLYYLENRGAAFGILENSQWIFILFALLISGFAIYVLKRMPSDRHYLPLRGVCILVSAGAIGNMIDRIVHGFVVDFFYCIALDFPVFNVADIYVCVSTAFLLILIFFYYKEEDFTFLSSAEKREKQENK